MTRSHRLTAFAASLACVVAGLALVIASARPDKPAEGVAALVDPQERVEQWKKVEDAVAKGLPKTAIQLLDPIIEGAIKDKAFPEAIKAVSKKIALEGNIQGNKPEEKITRMQAALAAAPPEMQPAMHAVLAHWYWHYFQQNRWRFVQRTQAGEASGNDITTWDLPRILGEIDKQFELALANEKELKAIPIANYNALLDKGTIPDKYRPTLWDFLAFDALSFYAAGEQAGAKAQDAFEIAADSPVFAPAAEFLKWNPETTDAKSATYKAVRLLQKILAFHQPDADKGAFLDADLHRLRFGFNKAVGEKDERYVGALKAFAEGNKDHELSAMARYQWATVLSGKAEYVQAREIALAGRNAFPNTPYGQLCDNVVKDVEAKSSQVTTERVWAEPLPSIKVHYRNLTRVYFRVVKGDYADRLKKTRWRPEELDQNERQNLLREKPVLTFEKELPATADYKPRDEYIPAPKGLPPGFYYLLSSHDPDFGSGDNVVSFTDVWVSDLAIVTRHDYLSGQLGGKLGGQVLNGPNGIPIEGAKVQVWIRGNNGGWTAGETATTDKNGLYSATGSLNHSHLVLVTHEKQQLASAHDHYLYQGGRPVWPQERTIFFTDRSLYRPGQTVQFKGICIRFNQDTDNYTTIANRDVTVVFADPNGKEVARARVRTNDYGSFHGSFTAPRDRLTGRMNLHLTQGDPPGMQQLSVEEYKRPKFQVKVEAPKDAFKLNDAVTVAGKATAYTGAPIGGAKVRYRVVREVRYPDWFSTYCWWRPMPRVPAQEIAHGVASTDPDGAFTVTFTAKPDLSIPEKDEPSFKYTVSTDVTDTTGETRSGSKSVEVGYTALRATVSADPWLVEGSEAKFTISTTTLDGEGQAAKGTLRIYKLKQPDAVARPELDGSHRYHPVAANAEPKPDPAKPVSWELGEVAFTADFATEANGKAALTTKLPAGLYRAVLTTHDKFQKPVTAKAQVQVLNPAADKLDIKVANVVAAPKWSLQPGEEFTMLWGTGYDQGRAFLEVEHRGKVIQSFWSDPAKTQAVLKQPVTEAMRGGFTVRVTFVRENRAYLTSHHVSVPWSNKDLTVKWERFVNKMEPGQKETFTAVVTGPDAKRAAAEMVATLYDESLDQYLPHQWQQGFGVFRQDYSRLNMQFENTGKYLQYLHGQFPHDRHIVHLTYRGFPSEVTMNYYRYEYFGKGGGYAMGDVHMNERGAMAKGFGGAPGGPTGGAMPASPVASAAPADAAEFKRAEGADKPGEPGLPPTQTGPNLDNVAARKNLNETAFFFPTLVADADGVVRIEFTMPEAMTKWKFMGFAHDRDLRAGYLEDHTVTAKDLMCEPNPPRFLREGDVIEFTAKVSNRSATRQQGKVRLSFRDARTDKPVGAELGLTAPEQAFDLAAGESKTFSWKLAVPDGTGPLIYKTVAASERLSDGEEGPLPVLSRRVLVQESLPLPIRGAGTKQFEFTKLKNSAQSDTIRSQSYTIQMVSQPAWYAVLALPYLMEYPHECTEQTFNRLYANSLARHIASSDPKIRRVFDQWKNTPALDSPLEKNQDLKAVTLEETPWLRQAVSEGQARKNVGILFDENRLNDETARTFAKLAQMQYPDGSWPWFPGGKGNDYITLYITTGFGRMRHLGVKVDMAPAVKSLARLDGWAHEQYLWAQKHDPEKNHLTPTIALYLYCRSFFLDDRKIAPEHRPMIDYWLGQAKKYWLQLPYRQSQGHLALATKRFGDAATATGIMASIKERSVSNEEMGMFWRDLELNFSWYRAPIETQALMIEAFDEVMNDAKAVEDCKVWLLKMKQTTDWKTTKATADAVYALLLRGDNLLKSDALVEVTVGGQTIKPEKVEAGTGFYEQRYVRNEITPSMANITLKKTDGGVSWGSAHWQYLEVIDKVTPHEGTPLKLEKRLFKRTFAKSGPVLAPVANDPVAVGDEIVVRIVLRTDRDMEYVHMKDQRGSGTEPVNVLSRYKYQDGLGYYEATKDTATHFFIDYLPKGTYVFEYAVRVQHRGKYPTGFAHIECMYAPEFNSHSENITLEAK